MLRIRYQIRFAKTGLLRWIGHRDLARLWERTLRRCRFELSMTEGFHPKPRISFPDALALGIEGRNEVVEIELAEELNPQELLRRLVADNQPGLKCLSVCRVPEGYGKAKLVDSTYEIRIPDSLADAVPQRIADLKTQSSIEVERKGERKSLPIAETLIDIRFLPNCKLTMTLAATAGASIRPMDILQALGLDEVIQHGSYFVRTKVRLRKEIDSQLCALAGDADADSTEIGAQATSASDPSGVQPAANRLPATSSTANKQGVPAYGQLDHEERNADQRGAV